MTRLKDACVESPSQKLLLESGPGTHFGAYIRGLLHGHDWWIPFRRARRWFEKNRNTAPLPGEAVKVFVFGFSRGALIARHFAAWLEKLDVEVAYLGLWDTVDATLGLDVEETCPGNVRFARHALARDERRRFYAYVPLKSPAGGGGKCRVEELVFPGSHSDVGGLYEDCHAVADASLAWIAEGAAGCGLLLKENALPEVPEEKIRTAVLHDSSDEATNLWGVLGGARRKLEGLRLHPLCGILRRIAD